MIFKIKTPEQAAAILQVAAQTKATGDIIFDLDDSIDPYTVPLILRECDRGSEQNSCSPEGVYLGWNIWGKGFEKRSTYCPKCGYAMREKAVVSVAIQGKQVFQTNYRTF